MGKIRDKSKPAQRATLTFRIYSEELERIKHAATAQRINLSDLVRSILFSAPILSQSSADLQDEKKDDEQEEMAELLPLSESIVNVRGKTCVHGFKVRRGATQCFTCSNLGVKYRE